MSKEIINFVQLDIGGLSFCTTEKVTNELVADFIRAYKPSHVYTNIEVQGHSITCTVDGYETNPLWSSTPSEVFHNG